MTETDQPPTPKTPPPRFQRRHFDRRLWHRSRDFASEPRGLGTLEESLDAVQRVIHDRVRGKQIIVDHTTGVSLIHDAKRGCYRLAFESKASERPEFQSVFQQQIKPLLTRTHAIDNGPVFRFNYLPATQEWSIRYLFVLTDDQGQEITKEGKPVLRSCQKQVQPIAEMVAHEVAAIIESLIPPFPNDEQRHRSTPSKSSPGQAR